MFEQKPVVQTNIDTTSFEKIVKILEQSNKSIIIHGKAGTGKSTFIAYLKRHYKNKWVVVAPTGIAAINVGGQTIHSFFKFPPRFIDVTHISKAKKTGVYKKIDLLIIDEISMVRADILDGIDRSLRINRNRSDVAFGGVKVMMVGDIYQLPPVVRREEEIVFKQNNYKGHYFFNSRVFKEITESDQLNVIELSTVYRQKDEAWVESLNNIRVYEYGDKIGEVLDKRIVASKASIPEPYITLTTTNKLATKHNEERLAKLPSSEHEFTAEISGDFPEGDYPTEKVLRLKVGAQVLFIKNDEARQWVNGDIGIIKAIEAKHLVVLCKDAELQVAYQTWQRLKYEVVDEAIKEDVTGEFKQLPVRLGWAITIHKSQGQTYDRVLLDTAVSAFAPGQLYVALSRCRTYEGIFMLNAIAQHEIIINKELDVFWELVKDKIIHEDNLDSGKPTIDKYATSVVACINELSIPYGKLYISGILMGSKNKKIFENKHNQLKSYGALRGDTQEDVCEQIDSLIAQGIIATSKVWIGQFYKPVLGLRE